MISPERETARWTIIITKNSWKYFFFIDTMYVVHTRNYDGHSIYVLNADRSMHMAHTTIGAYVNLCVCLITCPMVQTHIRIWREDSKKNRTKIIKHLNYYWNVPNAEEKRLIHTLKCAGCCNRTKSIEMFGVGKDQIQPHFIQPAQSINQTIRRQQMKEIYSNNC